MTCAKTDFNDLHTLYGLDAVRLQLESARRRAAGSGIAGLPATSPPASDTASAANPSHAHPGESAECPDEDVTPVQVPFGTYSLIELQEHFSMIDGTDTVWDNHNRVQMKLGALRHIVGRTRSKFWE